MTYVHDVHSNQSEFVVYDAKTMDPTPVARVQLPQRVPYGFTPHSLTEQELQQQL